MNLISSRSTRLTTSDWFCGAGGSSEGARFSGVEVVAAANHWELAIETHNTNHPDTDHYLTNLSQADPRYFPTTNILWASPECSNHSLAKGKRRKNLGQLSLFDPAQIDPSAERSRATMWCVPRFAEYHQYELVIVENVVDVRHWVCWDAWLHAMDLLGYHHQTCYFNTMFFHPRNGLSDYAPQSRDRIYIVFWRKGNPKPDLEFRPLAWCPKCEQDVKAVQSWKNPQKRWGRYGARRQYLYRCRRCADVVEPYYYAAFNAVDWSIEAPRIGDRDRPLKPKTLERIRIGLEKYGRQELMIQLDHTHCTHPHNRVHALVEPLPTQTGRQTLAFIVSARGEPRHSHSTLPLSDPLPTTTTTNLPFIVELFGSSRVKGIDKPLGCVTAGGVNYGLATPFTLQYYTRKSATEGLDQALPTVSTENRHALVMPQPFVASYYGGSDVVNGVDKPLPTCSTVDRHALVVPEGKLRVEDCGFRMFKPHEIKDAMGFKPEYVLLGNKRQQVKLSGNAVTPPVAEWLYRRCADTLHS